MSRYLLILYFFVVIEAEAIDIIAHRGFACDMPENTVNAIKQAWSVSADAVELDLQN